MSIRVVRCSNCGKELFREWGSISYSIIETFHNTPCEKCSQSLNKEESYLFCNSVCLVEWIKKRGWIL